MAEKLLEKYLRFHNSEMPISVMEADWPSGTIVEWHTHPRAQLLYAIEGVMVIKAGSDSWVVPPNRALWLPAEIEHMTEMTGEVKMRTVYIEADLIKKLPSKTRVINVSNLLRELILAAVQINNINNDSLRNNLLIGLLVEELAVSDELPFHLPIPQDGRIKFICDSLLSNSDNTLTLNEWAVKINIATKTIQRLFLKETGMTFARWREQARLLNALRLIANGARIIDTAYECGYSNPSAFTAMFKRTLGIPPSNFYRKVKK